IPKQQRQAVLPTRQVRQRDECVASGPQHPIYLGQHRIEVREVVEHPVGRYEVERAVREWEGTLPHVELLRHDALTPRFLESHRIQIYAVRLSYAEAVSYQPRQPAKSTTEIE